MSKRIMKTDVVETVIRSGEYRSFVSLIREWAAEIGWDEGKDIRYADIMRLRKLTKKGGPLSMRTIDDAKLHPELTVGRWFLSDQTDFSVYDGPSYMLELYYCYRKLSITNLWWISAQKQEPERVIVDLGGSVFSSAYMSIEGGMKVYLANIEGTTQMDFARWFLKKMPSNVDVEIVPADDLPRGVPITVMEYLEHFRTVDTELARIDAFSPPRIWAASSFCTIGAGHFIPISINGLECYKVRDANAAFKALSEKMGYDYKHIDLWNCRMNRLTKR